MPAKTWSSEAIQFLKDNYLTLSHKEMGEILGKTHKAINSKCKSLKLTLPGEIRLERRKQSQKKAHSHKILNGIQGQFIKDNYMTMPIKTIAKELGLQSQTSVRTFMRHNGLEVPKEIALAFKTKGMFRLGVTPVNKGKKQTEYMTNEAIEKTKATRFQKGQKPINFNDIGTQTVDKDGYIKIKIANPNRWMYLHRLIWMRHNGAIPHTHIVIFKDGNNRNFDLSNLQLISKMENLKRNYNPEKAKASSKELHDNYVAGVLKRGTALKSSEIPKELIEIKRTALKINRELKKLNQNESKQKSSSNPRG